MTSPATDTSAPARRPAPVPGGPGYGRFVGRVGALAIALGIGAAVVTGGTGIAYAEDGTEGGGTNGTSAGDNADNDTGSSTDDDSGQDDKRSGRGDDTAVSSGDGGSGADSADEQADKTPTTAVRRPGWRRPGMRGPRVVVRFGGESWSSTETLDRQPAAATDPASPQGGPAPEQPVTSTQLPTPADVVSRWTERLTDAFTGAPAGSALNQGHTPPGAGDSASPARPESAPAADIVDAAPTTAAGEALHRVRDNGTTDPVGTGTGTGTAVAGGITHTLISGDPESAARSAQPTATTLSTAAPPVSSVARGPVAQIVSNLLAAVGLGPGSAVTNPVRPLSPQTLLGFLALIRREIEYTFFNKPPQFPSDTIALTTSSDVPAAIAGLPAVDPDGDPVAYTAPARGAVGGPQHGTVTVTKNAAGVSTVTYTPDAGYTGTDTFTLTAADVGTRFRLYGLGSLFNPRTAHTDTATVTVTVAAATGAPPVANPDAFDAREDTPFSGNVLANDTDIDTDREDLTAHLVSGPGKAAAFVLNRDGSFTYTPTANSNGTDTFTYRTFDGQAYSAPTTVTLTVAAVDDPPVITSVTPSTPDTSTGAITYTVTVTDVDTDADDLNLTVSPPVDGTGTVSTPTRTGAGTYTFTYTPSAAERVAAYATTAVEKDRFTITVTDAAGRTQQQVEATVDPTAVAVTELGTGVPPEASIEPQGATLGRDGTVYTVISVRGEDGRTTYALVTRTAAGDVTSTPLGGTPYQTGVSVTPVVVPGRDGDRVFQPVVTDDGRYEMVIVNPDGSADRVELPGAPAAPMTVGADGRVHVITAVQSPDSTGFENWQVTTIRTDNTSSSVAVPAPRYSSVGTIGSDVRQPRTEPLVTDEYGWAYLTTPREVVVFRGDGTVVRAPITRGEAVGHIVFGERGLAYQAVRTGDGYEILRVNGTGFDLMATGSRRIPTGQTMTIVDGLFYLPVSTPPAGFTGVVVPGNSPTDYFEVPNLIEPLTAVGDDRVIGLGLKPDGQTVVVRVFQPSDTYPAEVLVPGRPLAFAGADGGIVHSFASDDRLYVPTGSFHSATVNIVNPDNTVTEVPLPDGILGLPVVDGNGYLHVLSRSDATTLTIIAPDGSTTILPMANASPDSLKVDSDGRAYVTTPEGVRVIHTANAPTSPGAD